MGEPFLTGDWTRATFLLGEYVRNGPNAVDMAVRDEAALFLRKVIEGFSAGGLKGKWAPIQTITAAMRRYRGRGGSKPLMASGDLRRSINLEKEADAHYWVGVNRTSKAAKSSAPMANVAAVHEFGAGSGGPIMIPITEKMRRFFKYLWWKKIIPFPFHLTKRSWINIPRRSFLQDALEVWAQNHEARLFTRYANYLGGYGSRKLVD